MPFQLAKSFAPSYKLMKPKETATGLTIQLAAWDTGAQIMITNEPGKKFKVGFVQVLYENDITVTYEQHIRKDKCNPLPVLDSDPTMFPWYESDIAYSPEVNGTAGAVTVEAKISDKPKDTYTWYKDVATSTDAMKHLKYRLKFRTWLVVRDITAPIPPQSFVAVLSQFNYVIEAEFNVFVTNSLGQRCPTATGMEKSNKPELVSPPLPIHKCIWVDKVANDCLQTEWMPRTVVKSSTAPVGPVVTGVNVKDLAKNFGR